MTLDRFSMRGMLAALVAALIPLVLPAQSGPYAGQEAREIKALSSEEVAAYVAGDGMGYAKAAELNHYPGPKHVLELGKELKLTETQVARTGEIHRRMKDEAVRIGKAIIEKEKSLDRLFAGGKITPESLSRATGEIARLQGELRATHLKAHLETRSILTPDQVASYDALRGYGTGEHAGHAHGASR